jgi:hypothetical protein|tara:strand:+ start:2244 stop:2429 length:186 start_codon:yes stop_codon:yes gene_type:complete
MIFELHFRNELKRLNFKRYHVCTILGCTMPTLKTRIENPGSFTVDEVKKLENSGFDVKRLI